ncbi:hypothetical protein [Roseisolibacter agri]|uniref:Uncharacterized protein n=1 Tax=Roseisolibacter agri TaxID=2014610 RepID=A0AA37Q754_9BACT|nr:hypothetical protein [Roseisolibacter agri]GLC25927.1 hypothetical protein rosag_24400 [Roseisolibacter agri]
MGTEIPTIYHAIGWAWAFGCVAVVRYACALRHLDPREPRARWLALTRGPLAPRAAFTAVGWRARNEALVFAAPALLAVLVGLALTA